MSNSNNTPKIIEYTVRGNLHYKIETLEINQRTKFKVLELLRDDYWNFNKEQRNRIQSFIKNWMIISTTSTWLIYQGTLNNIITLFDEANSQLENEDDQASADARDAKKTRNVNRRKNKRKGNKKSERYWWDNTYWSYDEWFR